VGWTKGLELAKVARRDGQEFDCATWLHRARSLPKRRIQAGSGKGTDRQGNRTLGDYLFQTLQERIPVIEQAIETAALMLGTAKSRGYCLEMICADVLAGANLDSATPEILLDSVSRMFKFLPGQQKQTFLDQVDQKASA